MLFARIVEKVLVLVVIGVTENGQKRVIGIQSGDKESASSWRETFKHLKRRGLDSQTVTLGIMDGLPGFAISFMLPVGRKPWNFQPGSPSSGRRMSRQR